MAGLLVQALHITLPEVLVSFAGKMNSAATPLILLLLGASFETREIARYKKSCWCVWDCAWWCSPARF